MGPIPSPGKARPHGEVASLPQRVHLRDGTKNAFHSRELLIYVVQATMEEIHQRDGQPQ